MPLRLSDVLAVLSLLKSFNTTLPELISFILKNAEVLASDPSIRSAIDSLPAMLDIFADSDLTRTHTASWAVKKSTAALSDELDILIHDPATKFNAAHTLIREYEDIDIEKIASHMSLRAPTLWATLGHLLSTPEDLLTRREREREGWRRRRGKATDMSTRMEVDGVEEGADGITEVDTAEDRALSEADTRIQMKRVVCISIVMNHRNALCNNLQSLVGVFLRACNAPESVINFISHIGLSNAPSTIHANVAWAVCRSHRDVD